MNSLSTSLGRLLTLSACMLGVACSSPVDAGDAGAPSLSGPVEMGAPFCDHAVLQREQPVPVWGWSQPGAKVTVEFKGQKKEATAGKDGKWMLELDSLDASFEPAAMVVTSSAAKAEPLTINNILVGEVWMASGQSNMQWKAGKSDCANLKVEPRDGVHPIREFEVTSVFAMLHPIERATGAWKDGEYSEYSAIAYAFAHKLYGELGVPIGILNCSFSQTSIQAWVPRVGFRDAEDDYTKAIYRKVLETDPATPEHAEAWGGFYQRIEDAIKQGQAIPEGLPGNMNGNRDATWLFNGRLSPVVPYAIRGTIWNQGYANMGEGLPYYHNLHSLIRGWRTVWDKPELPFYFHQFYAPGNNEYDGKPSIGSTAEMRLGTVMARDIPHANMASQIDIQGAIHYRNKAVPGQRLALHALKNQYGKKVVADGPIYKSYTVKGNQVIVEFDHADGGLVVASPKDNTSTKDGGTGFADPKVIPDGVSQVKLFYVADEKRVWYPATVKLDGGKAIVSSPMVKNPRGVTYGTGGIGFQPNLYNQALLPMSPFIVYDNEPVTSNTWPEEKLAIHGEVIDPSTIGLAYEYRKMALLSTQFRDNAVLQSGQPVTIWGSCIHPLNLWGDHIKEEGERIVQFSFNGIEKTIPVTDGMKEWQVTIPPMKAGTDPKTLKVTFTIDGELVHEREVKNIVIGDVWYVAAPDMEITIPEVKPSGQIVRMMERQAKRDAGDRPSRFTISTSTDWSNRFASTWKDAEFQAAGDKKSKGKNGEGLAAAIGHHLAAKTGGPVGIIFMQSNAGGKSEELNPEIKSWFPPEYLKGAPSLMDDYKQLASLRPGNEHYAANARRYIAEWKGYWSDYIPKMIATRAVPDGVPWGKYPSFQGEVTTKASQTYNVMVCSFTPASLKGIIFLSSPIMVKEEKAAVFGEQISALANGLKTEFACEDPRFIYTLPGKQLVPGITRPDKIEGASAAVEITDWKSLGNLLEEAARNGK